MIETPSNLAQAFSEVVEACADRIALAGGQREFTYRELDRISDCLAYEIVRRGVNQGDRVAILMDHESPLVVAVLSVIKAGCVVVVMNPGDPAARLTTILTDAESSLIVTDSEHVGLAGSLSETLPAIVFSPDHVPGKSFIPPGSTCEVNDIASLVYTSGSTGRPKAVMKTHQHLLANTQRMKSSLQLRSTDRLAGLASLSGGHGEATTWLSLLTGATLCLFPVMVRGVTGLAEWFSENDITYFSASSSLFRSFVRTLAAEKRLDHIRIVRLASDPATVDDLASFRRHFNERCLLVHTLASSETGVLSCWKYEGRDPDQNQIPVGHPLPGIHLFLRDRNGQEVPPGKIGEIVVRSNALVGGYWKMPELTAERFRPAPDGSGERIFCTGDRAMRLADGSLLFAGRSDGRLKIRGYRIEPTEIELALRAFDEIEQAVVCDVPGPSGHPLLAAFLVFRSRSHLDSESIRRKLSKSLADHLIPARFMRLEQIPLTPNGKIDRGHMRSLLQTESQLHSSDPPRTATEKHLGLIWENVFQRSAIGRNDHFFELGGDSLIAAVISAHVYAEWKVEISMKTFGDRPVLKSLAKAIDRAKIFKSSRSEIKVDRISRNQPMPLSYLQEMIWNECQSPQAMHGWTIAARQLIRGPLNVEVFHLCLQRMIERHEILRTTFHSDAGELYAVVHDHAEVSLDILDFTSQENPLDSTIKFCREQTRNTRMELGHLPLVRFCLIRTGEQEHVLFRLIHHIVSDNWSWNLFFNELALLYEGELAGKNVALSPAPQYADYAAWRRKILQPESKQYRRGINWWKKQFRHNPARLQLPFTRRRRCEDAKHSEGLIFWEIPLEVSRRLDRVAAQQKVTYLVIRLAVFLATVAESTGQRDLVIGCLSTGRTRLEWQNTFGMFATTIALRVYWNPAKNFLHWLRVVSDTITRTMEHDQIPFHILWNKIAVECGYFPELNVQFSVSDLNVPRTFGGLELSSAEREFETMPWGFTMKLGQNPATECYTSFDAHIHDPQRVHRFLDRYLQLLDVLSSHPKSRLSRVMQEYPSAVLPLPPNVNIGRSRDAA